MARLALQPDGTFLARFSATREGCFSIDVLVGGGQFYPVLVQPTPGGGVLLPNPPEGLGGPGPSAAFPSLVELVRSQKSWLVAPCPRPPTDDLPAAPLLDEGELPAPADFEAFASASRGLDLGGVPLRREGSEEGEQIMREGEDEDEMLMLSGEPRTAPDLAT